MTMRRNTLTDMVDGLGLPQPPRINIGGNRFTLVNSDGAEFMINLVDPAVGYYLDVVIVTANPVKSKIFFENEYTPGVDDPPVCWSDNGVAPSSNALKPQAARCDACQWNVIGSDVSKLTGKSIKACQDSRKCAVFIVGYEHAGLFLMQVKPGSFKNLSTYGRWLASHPGPNGGQADTIDVVTRVSFVPQQNGILAFAAVASADQAMYERIAAVDASNAAANIIGLDDKPFPGAALAGPAPVQQIAPPAQQALPAPPAALAWPVQAPQTYQPAAPPPPVNVLPFAPAQQQEVATKPASRRGGVRNGAGRPRVNAGAQQEVLPPQTPAQQPQAWPAQQPAPHAPGQRLDQQQQAWPVQLPPQPIQQPPQPIQQPPQPVAASFQMAAAQPVAPAAIPDFLRRGAAPVAQVAPPGPGPTAPMQPAANLSAEMKGALDRAFNAPLPPQR